MTIEHVRRPADLGHTVPLRRILGLREAASMRASAAKYGLDGRDAREADVDDVLTVLATSVRLADAVTCTRWVWVRDGLHAGATLVQLAAALDVDVDDVVVGYRAWTAGQAELRATSEMGLTRVEADNALAVLDAALEAAAPGSSRPAGGPSSGAAS